MANSTRRRVLLTGATGYIASQLLPVFAERYELRLTDARPTNAAGEKVGEVTVLDLVETDDASARALFSGCDAVVHLGYFREQGGSWETRPYEGERRNVDMAQRVFQLSLEQGVRRVVMASSNHAADWYEYLIRDGLMDVVDPDRTPPRLDNYYGWPNVSTCTKFSEGARLTAAARSAVPIEVQSICAS